MSKEEFSNSFDKMFGKKNRLNTRDKDNGEDSVHTDKNTTDSTVTKARQEQDINETQGD